MAQRDGLLFEGEGSVDSERIIYTPSAFAKTSLLHLQEVGKLKAKKRHTSSRRDLSSYLFFIVEEGSGTVEYGGESYRLARNDCAFIDCQKSYAHSTDENLWKIRWVHFYGPNMSAIYDKYISRGGKCCFEARDAKAFYAIIRTLYALASSTDYIRDMKIHEKLSSLLVLLMEESGFELESGVEGKTAHLQAVKDYLDSHYTEKITLADLSARFFINKYYLLEIFKRQYGMGVGQYLIHLRITKSKGLLRFTDQTLDQISYACGMNSPQYFSRMFKKVEGVSPSEYRKNWVK